MSFFNQHMSGLSVPQLIGVNNDRGQTDADSYFPQATPNGTLKDVVIIILSSHSFTYPNGYDGLKRSFRVLDELTKKIGSTTLVLQIHSLR